MQRRSAVLPFPFTKDSLPRLRMAFDHKLRLERFSSSIILKGGEGRKGREGGEGSDGRESRESGDSREK